MLAVITETFAPLLSLFIFVLGNGFFSTLLALVMTVKHEPPIAIGAMTGVFYAGLVLGSFRIEHLINRVGHIRAYSAFSSTLAITCLLHGIVYDLGFWLILRFVAGFATAGLFVVIESWLLCKGTRTNRGQILSLYMITFYGAQSFGQFFLNLGDPQTMLLFAITSMLCSLSIIPLSMTKSQSPQFEEPSTLKLRKLIKESASGLFGCFAAGLIMSSIYALMPTYLSNLFQTKADVARYMFAIIFGGMLLQYPVGKLSDLFERRLVLIIIGASTIVVSLAIILLPHKSMDFFLLMGLLGGLTFTFYPISITHACDNLDTKDLIAGTQSLLLAYSIGAMFGPFLAPVFMHLFGGAGLFLYFICVSGSTIPLFLIRKKQKKDTPPEEPFLSLPQTSPILLELDPRSESVPQEAPTTT